MLLVALLALWVQSAPPDWQAQGLKALDEKRFDAAAEAFQKAVERDPKDYSALFNLALADSLLRKDADAIAAYEKVLELKPGLYEADLNLGILLIRNKRAEDAIAKLKQASESRPKEFRPAYYLGEAYLASGQAGEAESAYRSALEIDSKSAPAEAGLGRTLLKSDHLAEAAEHLRKAGELDPAYKNDLLQVAEAYEAKQQAGEALRIYEQFPDNVGAQERAAQILLGQGRAGEAIPRLEAAMKAQPIQANRMALAAAYINAKQFDKGAALLAQAIQSEPNNYELRMMAGRLLRDQHKYNQASGQFFEATKIKPDSADAWSDLGGTLVLAEQYPQAIAALDRVKSLGAEKPGHIFFRAISLDHLHQNKPALAAYQAFLAASAGSRPDEEFKARQRVRILEKEISKK
jgi:tetratricopeptide (TPR) repeat protein